MSMIPLKKIVTTTGAVATVLMTVLLGLYWQTWNSDPDATTVDVQIMPETIHIGDVIVIEIETMFPWYRTLNHQVDVDLPDGLQLVSDDKQRFSGISPGRWKWISTLEIQAYDFGPFESLVARVNIRPNRENKNAHIEVTIPQLEISSSLDEDDSDLMMASELPETFLATQRINRYTWIIGGVLAIVAILLMIYFNRKKGQSRLEIMPDPWVVAENAIGKLEERFPLDAETVFVELTDIVRQYVESAYSIPATERTTPEFLRDIDGNGSKLSTENGLLLTDFLTAADMVKFAKADASQEQMSNTVKKAKRFIVQTSESLIRELQTNQDIEKSKGETC